MTHSLTQRFGHTLRNRSAQIIAGIHNPKVEASDADLLIFQGDWLFGLDGWAYANTVNLGRLDFHDTGTQLAALRHAGLRPKIYRNRHVHEPEGLRRITEIPKDKAGRHLDDLVLSPHDAERRPHVSQATPHVLALDSAGIDSLHARALVLVRQHARPDNFRLEGDATIIQLESPEVAEAFYGALGILGIYSSIPPRGNSIAKFSHNFGGPEDLSKLRSLLEGVQPAAAPPAPAA